MRPGNAWSGLHGGLEARRETWQERLHRTPPLTAVTTPLATLACVQNVNALVVGTTHRYKGKYVTTVLYKPRSGRRRGEAAAASHPNPFSAH